jgi:hypothetical protein
MRELSCNHLHVEDSWHPFQYNIFKDHLAVNHANICREIDFLVQHRFVSVTYYLGAFPRMFLRIYIIPFDLANVQGELRVRKEIILGPARRYLRKLLPMITQDHDNWNGDGLPVHYPPLIPSAKVISYVPPHKVAYYILLG